MHRICKNSGDETRIHNICKVVAGGTKPISSIIYYALKVKKCIHSVDVLLNCCQYDALPGILTDPCITVYPLCDIF